MGQLDDRIGFDGNSPAMLRVDLDGDDLLSLAGAFTTSDESVALETDLGASVEALISACERPGGGIGLESAEFLREWAEALETAACRLREAGATRH